MSDKPKTAAKKASSKDAKDKKSTSPPPKKEDKKSDKKVDTKPKKPDTSLNTKRSNNESRVENKDENTTNKDKINDSHLLDIMNTKKTIKPTNNQTKYVEKCEGCYDNDGVCFCCVCEKIYCKMCESQIHMVPSNMTHERLPISEIHHLKKLCYHHNQPLKFYCESCEEPICHECHHIGPHNNKLHKISNVIDSFRKKFTYINNVIQNNLLEKYDILINHLQTIDFTTEQVKLAKNEIERGIRTEYTKMIEDLRSEEGKKLAMLQSDASILQKDLNRINDVIGFVKDVNSTETPDMVAFLLRFRKINETVELCLAKQAKRNIDIKVDDFPREIENRNKKLLLFEKMKKLVNVKDEIIWSVIQENKKAIQQEIAKIQEKHYNEIVEWNKIVDKHMIELKNYQLICHFCGLHLDNATVNTNCSKNSSDVQVKDRLTSSNVPNELINTQRHFFGVPIKEFPEKFTNFKNLNLQTNQLINKQSKSLNFNSEIFNETLKDDTYKVINKLKTNAKSTKFSNLESLLSEVLFKESDSVNTETLRSFLKFKLDLEEYETNKFLSHLKKTVPSSGTQHTLKQVLLAIKNDGSVENTSNPFENNILSEFAKSKSYNEFDMSKVSDWIFKVSKMIENNNIRLGNRLQELDYDGDGYVYSDDLRLLFLKLKLNLNTNDIENMIAYFGFSPEEKISIDHFTKNFLGHLNEAK